MNYHLLRLILWLNRAGEDNHIKAMGIVLLVVLVPVWFFTRDAGPLDCAAVCELAR